jgi:hypothetical protein
MLARWFLLTLLLLHPVRGVLAVSTPAGRATDACERVDGASVCCPMCVAFDECPCAGEPGRDEDPAPATPPVAGDGLRLIPGGIEPVWNDERPATAPLSVRPSRGPPAASSVNAFLSVVCVWTI